jgi:hypothetical protein
MRSRPARFVTRLAAFTVTLLMLPAVAFAQSPWERAANNLSLTFTGLLARSLRWSRSTAGYSCSVRGRGARSPACIRWRTRTVRHQFLDWLF